VSVCVCFSDLALLSIDCSCHDVDEDGASDGDQVYMQADYSVSCTSEKYRVGYYWAVVCIFIYPIGIPALYYYLLRTHRQDIMCRDIPSASPQAEADRARRLRPLSFLFQSYRPRLWYWEIVETLHRLLLTGVLVLVEQGSPIQIIVGILIALLFLMIYERFEPYDDSFILPIKLVSQWQIFSVFFLALLIKADFPSIGPVALGACIVVVIFLNIFLDVFKLLSTFVVVYRSNSRSSLLLDQSLSPDQLSSESSPPFPSYTPPRQISINRDDAKVEKEDGTSRSPSRVSDALPMSVL
jgi:hypothetical protein